MYAVAENKIINKVGYKDLRAPLSSLSKLFFFLSCSKNSLWIPKQRGHNYLYVLSYYANRFLLESERSWRQASQLEMD